jgi:hypothetical protein
VTLAIVIAPQVDRVPAKQRLAAHSAFRTEEHMEVYLAVRFALMLEETPS